MGLRPSQPLPVGHGQDNQWLGFLEATAVVPRLNQLLDQADPRHLITTNPVGVGLKIWGDAQQAEIDRLRKQGYEPGGIGAFAGLGALALAPAISKIPGALKAPASWWGAVKNGGLGFAGGAAITQGPDTPTGKDFDKAASSIGSLQSHLPSWLDFRYEGRPPTRLGRR